MTTLLRSSLLRMVVLAGPFVASASPLAAQQLWTQPTPEELSMTSVPASPGAPAVILYKEQTSEDNLHMWSWYYRVKVLTEGGKDQANVELPYITNLLGISINSIVARTIHPDGSVTVFTGKPYDKLVQKTRDYSINEKVFTLPAVEVGSILEYRYKLRFDDGYYLPPEWMLQSDLFTRNEHFSWKPTGYVTSGDMTEPEHVAWTPLLPPGAKIEQKELHVASTGSSAQPTVELTLDVKDVPAFPKESNMPPLESLSYRVQFYYTSAKTPLQYWADAGKTWSKARDKFIGPGGAVKAKAKSLVEPGDTEEVQLKKLYDFVMTLENTDYTRSRSKQEDKAAGLKDINNTDDILKHGRGSSDQLAELFVALARATGNKMYLMDVTDRDKSMFQANLLDMSQLDDYIAVAPIDGKEVYFDPGERFCTFKHLSWKHSYTGGLRQTESGTAVAPTPAERYTASHTGRVADLTLDEHGTATGTVVMTYTGDPALRWRQAALRGDEESLHRELRESLEDKLPGGMEIKVVSVENIANSEKPFEVTYNVKGAVGSPTGKRLFVPANLFQTNSKPIFTGEKRELPVDMHFAQQEQDAVRYKYPAAIVVESAPAPDEVHMKNEAAFSVDVKQTPGSVTLYRNLTVAVPFFPVAEYPELHTFYSKVDGKQQDTLVLTHDVAAAKPAAGN